MRIIFTPLKATLLLTVMSRNFTKDCPLHIYDVVVLVSTKSLTLIWLMRHVCIRVKHCINSLSIRQLAVMQIKGTHYYISFEQ